MDVVGNYWGYELRNLVAKLYQSVCARNFTDVNVQLGNKCSVLSENDRIIEERRGLFLKVVPLLKLLQFQNNTLL